MIGAFAALKWRLLRNGWRRTTRSPFAAFGFAMSAFGAFLAAVAGFALFSSLRWERVTIFGPDSPIGFDNDPAHVHRIIILATSLMVFGWWFAPLISGGVDETVDPTRLVLLPLTRTQIRRGQIVAGFIGMAPIAMVVWTLGIMVGMTRSVSGAAVVIVAAACLPLAGLVGSRALATSLARLTLTRRGGDVVGLIAAAGGASIFAFLQLARFIDLEDLDPVVSVLRWTPPGMVGDAIERASRGEVVGVVIRLAPIALVIVATGWWWTRQLDALLTNSERAGGGEMTDGAGALAIFAGVRRFLPHSPVGAGLAREVVYLRRSPGRRAVLISGAFLGVVDVVVFVQGLRLDAGQRVMVAPLATLFSLQYASNQFGVDPTSFWLDIVTGAPPLARVVGRQLLAAVTLFFPVAALAAVGVAVWGGAWVECGAALIATLLSLPSIVAVGSVASPSWAVPIPDSGNPFSNRQTLGGNGCMAGLVGFLFMLLVTGFIIPIELD